MKTTLARIVATLLFPALAFSQSPAVGGLAPDFTLPYATKDSIARYPLTLSETVTRSAVLLAFYPANWSSGCTQEVCSIRDDIESFTELGVEVLAISGDYVYSHHAWAQEHDLPFKLLSDHDHAVARAYSSFNEGSGYNRRTVFVVGQDMRIRYADMEYSVRDDSDLLAVKRALRGSE